MIYDYCQSDARWGQKPYTPNMTYAVGGCGPTACADIIGQRPDTIGSYLVSIGGATDGQGTNWNAIPKALSHFGFGGVQLNTANYYGTYNSSVEKQWLEQMKTGKYYGILLMGKGYFCTSGHFIAIKQVDEQNRAYALDPAYSPRSGWHNWSVYQGMVKVFYLADNKDAQVDDGDYAFKTEQIQLGSSGVDVFRLEVILKARGYYTGELDSQFGWGLNSAVKAWQTKAGLVVDGIFGPMSWATLLGLGTVNGYWIAQKCQIGESGNNVFLLQEGLKGLGYNCGALDRSFGNQTRGALLDFQKAAGLPQTGVGDKATFQYMFG